MKFAYSKFEIGNGKNIYRPLVRILFRNGKNFILTKGIIVYPSKIKISHILDQNGFRSIKWDDEVYFAESQPNIILGNHGFLDNFQILLDGLRKEVEITT